MERFKLARLASVLGIIGNCFLLIIKFLVSLITNSQAMIGDAINSAADIFSSLMTYIGNHIASKNPDDNHNLGHGKAEYIFSLLISISMIYVAAKFFCSSFKTIFVPNAYHFSYFLIVVCIVTIIVKLALYFFTIKIAKQYHNVLIKANAIDHRNDVLLTSLNLVAAIMGMFNVRIVDSIVGIIVALYIFITGLKLFKESFDVLMDASIDEASKQKVLDIIAKYDSIEKINHFNATPVGYRYQISFTIFVDGNMSTFASHEIANNLEKEISALDEIYLTIIHVNPTLHNDVVKSKEE